MSENVSVEMFKIYVDSQSKHQTILHQELKETNKNLVSLIEVVREEVNTNKAILGEHILVYNRDKEDYKVRFKNLFKRQDKIDGMLTERAPAWFVFKTLRKGLAIFLTAIIVLLAAFFGVMVGIK